MMKDIQLGEITIGPSHPPFIVAEMSGNHNQSLERALQIVDAAADAGVHALKIQTYTADTMTLPLKTGEFFIEDKNSLWKGKSLYELYQEAYTPWEWHKPIFDRCRERGILGFSTPFDETAVDFLEELEVPFYKIASFENTDVRLIKKTAQTGKPIVISTGMASIEELNETVSTVRSTGNDQLILLKCTSTYPADPVNSNIRNIPDMQNRFQCQIGLSDHTMGLGVSVASIALGATFIEKHFCLSRAEGGVDSAFSLEPHEMKALVTESLRAWQGLGEVKYSTTRAEEKSKVFRRSLYIAKDIKAGEKLTPQNVRAIRPGLGLPVKYYDEIMGKTLKRDCPMGTALSWELIQNDK